MRICYIGCVHSSAILLRTLIDSKKEIVGVVTKSTSKYNSDFETLIPLCREANIPYRCADQAAKKEIADFVRSCTPDVLYCFGWSQLLPEEILNIPTIGGVGFHPAALPHNKGRHPLIWALALGLTETASTFFRMTDEADAGDIISQERILIAQEDDARTLYQKVMDTAVKQVMDFTEYIEKNGKMPFVKENSGGNVWRKRNRLDGQIDFRMSAQSIYNLVRALTHPYVGAHFYYEGKEYKVWRSQIYEKEVSNNLEPGKILHVNSLHDFIVKTGDGAVHILDCDEVELRKGEYLQ